MNKAEFERKLRDIPEVAADERDAEAIKRITDRDDEVTANHGKLMNEFGYSGKISLRVPKSLHKALAEGAKEEGISLNQFILYKLAKLDSLKFRVKHSLFGGCFFYAKIKG